MPQLFFYISFSLLVVCASCQSAANDTATAAATTTTTSTAGVLHLANTDTLPYPIISNFDELEPIFHLNNDTTYVINFWATWCGPCVEELPYFERLDQDYQGKPLKIILVSLDFRKNVRTKLLRFVEDRPLKLPVIALTDNKTNVWIDKVDPEWSGAIPITVIYRNDKRVFIQDQFADYEELASAVKSVL